jgi:outer membrane receptor protein involved in Fe transport
VQNITRVRGIPTDDGLALFQQDGLPLFHEINAYYFRGDSLERYDLMTERVEVVRGGPSPIYASQAAAIVNNITVTGSDTPEGRAQLTTGTTGLYRLDLMQSGRLADRTYYAVGGFVRRNDGYRDNGFPTDRGGQIRANLKPRQWITEDHGQLSRRPQRLLSADPDRGSTQSLGVARQVHRLFRWNDQLACAQECEYQISGRHRRHPGPTSRSRERPPPAIRQHRPAI